MSCDRAVEEAMASVLSNVDVQDEPDRVVGQNKGVICDRH